MILIYKDKQLSLKRLISLCNIQMKYASLLNKLYGEVNHLDYNSKLVNANFEQLPFIRKTLVFTF